MKKKILYIVSFFVLTVTFAQQDPVTKSVLAQGSWYKIKISNNGIYKIDKNYLESIGINTDNINPQNLAVYGNGGAILPQNSAISRTYDLAELPLYVSGESDGSFDDGDYALFYAQGAHQVEFEELGSGQYRPFPALVQKRNIYSDANYYYITIKDSPANRMTTQASLPISSHIVDNYNYMAYHEKDLNKLLNSGREWEGESFERKSKHIYNFNTPGVQDSIILTTGYTHQSAGVSTTFKVEVNNQKAEALSLKKTVSGSYGTVGVTQALQQVLAPSSSYKIEITHNDNGNKSARAFVNYVRINYSRHLQSYGNQTVFRNIKQLEFDSTTFLIDETNADYQVWKVDEYAQPAIINLQSYNGKLAFTSSEKALEEYILFKASNIATPSYVGRINNQNLHGVTSPNLLIITHPRFLTQAEELATFKRNYENLSVYITTPKKIYNEFSSGKQDITAIRDFTKMLYERNTGSNELKYLLLFGDASYDYKDITKDNTNLVPTYEARQSYHNVNTYGSDDYYGFLEDGEGEWIEKKTGDHTLEIGIGRFPVNTTEEAQIMVDKVIRYVSSNKGLGNWRNTICFVADDGDKGDGNLHINQANRLVEEKIKSKHPEFNVKKLYLDNYEQISGSSGQISPKAEKALLDVINKGALIVNYTGHGGETGWTQEQILTVGQFGSMKNQDNLPLFITATCEFGRYEDPHRQSAAEKLLTTPNGGIALITTTRPVYSSTNFVLSQKLYDVVLKKNIDGTYPRLGDIMRQTKNTSLSGIFNRNFSLLGDPSLTLSYPKEKIIIDSVLNESKLSDTISALSIVTLIGHIEDLQNNLDVNFEGSISSVIFDKQNTITTLGDYKDITYSYEDYNSIIFNGQTSVSEGKFKMKFVVPKDIAYNLGLGKISLYAQHDTKVIDANGVYEQLTIGGSNNNPSIDNLAPNIQLFMDDSTFVSGGNTGSNTVFIANLFDENGINLSSGSIGHETTLTLNGNAQNKIILNEFYTATQDDYQSGQILYALNDLPNGKHTITIKTWDTHNNSAKKSIIFYVGEEPKMYFFPNPFKVETKLVIDHERSGEDMDISLEVLNSTGQTVYTKKYTIESAKSRIEDITWAGINDFGQKLSEGLYFISVNLRYHSNNTEYSKVSRIVIIK